MITKKYLDDLTYAVIGVCIEVNQIMGSGLLESIYHRCLIEELKDRKINFLTEVRVPVFYKEKKLDVDLRCDLLIEECLVLELKAVNEIHPVFEAQLLTYMKLLKYPKGILINFHCKNIFKEGQKTFVNEHFRTLPEA